MKTDDPLLNTCIEFINSIGIATQFQKIEEESFLPGLLIKNGTIVIDEEALLYPGDILHEAGHIAVVPASTRPTLNHLSILESKNRESEEMMAIAWSYAACVYLQIDPYYVFHDNGYKGGANNIVENFKAGHYFGTPMLQWCGMTTEPKYGMKGDNIYPNMKKWLRD
jgi:hypothetical protein